MEQIYKQIKLVYKITCQTNISLTVSSCYITYMIHGYCCIKEGMRATENKRKESIAIRVGCVSCYRCIVILAVILVFVVWLA